MGLSEAIRQKVEPSPKFTLLFRQSRDGKEGTTFHRLCDKKVRTLIIIRSMPLEKGEIGHVFGGYTRETWNDDKMVKEDKTSFLFVSRLECAV